jgi:hypothetical protein
VKKALWDGRTLSLQTELPEWCDGLQPEERYYLSVVCPGWRLEGVEGGGVRRTVPDFEGIRPAPMSGPEGIAVLIPRDFNHPPVTGYRKARGHVIAFRPPAELVLTFERNE